jgi:hypothetical protein
MYSHANKVAVLWELANFLPGEKEEQRTWWEL